VCDSASVIAGYEKQLDANASYFTDLSYEAYILEPGGKLATIPGLTNGTSLSVRHGLRAHPMIITGYIERLRELFAAPGAFIAAVVEEARAHSYASFQIDFEPDGALQNDSVAYGAFLLALDAALAPTGTAVIVAMDEWSPLWNLTASVWGVRGREPRGATAEPTARESGDICSAARSSRFEGLLACPNTCVRYLALCRLSASLQVLGEVARKSQNTYL
jgi:hypothetical protein